ncbi:MAG: hypothetical protein EPO26_14165 [Chloroflexota bacterium]|nr:MAG: hypothetical protein EPO26_14165 [Chloroflexota bacterium]
MTSREREIGAAVWDDDQIFFDAPDESIATRLWAEIAIQLLGEDAEATVSVDCDDPDTESRLRVAGFKVAEIEPEETVEVLDSVTVENEGRLRDLLDPVLRLRPDGPLGALAIAGAAGVDFDAGAGIDVWGPGALAAARAAAASLGIAIRERAPDSDDDP